MIGFIENDGGREAAGYKGTTGDCMARAAAIVTGHSYQSVYDSVAEFMASHGLAKSANAYLHTRRQQAKNGNGKRVKNGKQLQFDWLIQYGFEKIKLPQRGERPTFTEAWHDYGDCVITTTKHIAALRDGALQDLWDHRTYEFMDYDMGTTYERERKAASVFIFTGGAEP